jgi:hypothetical protein
MNPDRSGNGAGAVPEPQRREQVLAELERILASAAFRNARRSQDLLRYVVTHALDGPAESLKERSIGIEVFQRTPDYDTGDDSIVRVKASELRKRLAQYYHDAPPGPVQIELPAGAYQPEFKWREAGSDLTRVPRKRPRLWAWLGATAAILVAVAAIAVLNRPAPTTALDLFWRPVLDSDRPILLCVAHPVVYNVRGRARELLSQTPVPDELPSADVRPDPDNFVGIGDAFTLAQLSGFLNRRGRNVQLRTGNDVSFADLRDKPAVLIGAFTNQWTMEMTSNLRYVFERSRGLAVVKDRMNPTQTWAREPENPALDYVILSRIFDSKSGQIIITAAGIAHIGTQMAGEILTSADYMQQAVRGAPPDWYRKNVQLVLAGEVIGSTVGPPKVVASWYW